jgi:hypothetical protein
MDLFPSAVVSAVAHDHFVLQAKFADDSVCRGTVHGLGIFAHDFVCCSTVLASPYGICKVSIAAEVRPFSAKECMVEIEQRTHFDFRTETIPPIRGRHLVG